MKARRLNPKENMRRVLTRNDPEYVPYRRRPRTIPGLAIVSAPNALAPKEGLDPWGVGWKNSGNDWESYPSAPPCRTAAELADWPFPEPTVMVAGLDEVLAHIDRSEALVVVYEPRGILERSSLLLGMEQLFMALLDEPDAVGQFYERLVAFNLEVAKLHFSLGIDGLRVADDFGTQTSTLLSPQLWRRFIKPALARWIAAYKDTGKFFFQHSCGYITPIMDDLVEIGIDTIDSLNPSAGNELELWKQRYGDRLNFMGGVDTHYVLTRGTDAEVREEVRLRLRQLAAGGGYILAPDQNIPYPEENYQAYLRAAAEFCDYPLRTDL